jgi:hypothetical protein
VTLREHSYPRSSETACRSSVHLGDHHYKAYLRLIERKHTLLTDAECFSVVAMVTSGVAARWRWGICQRAEAIAGRSAVCFFRTSENLLVLRKEVEVVQGIRQRRNCW